MIPVGSKHELLVVTMAFVLSQTNALQTLASVRRNDYNEYQRLATTRLHDMPILEEWTVLPNGRIEGKVINHAEIGDGWIISTSPLKNPELIESERMQNGMIQIETMSGSQYLLRPRREGSNDGDDSEIFAKDAGEKQQPFYYQMPSSDMDPAPDADMVAYGTSIDSINTDDNPAKWTTDAKALMQQVKDAGIAGVISYATWELGFWTVSVPVCVFAYKQVTGHWPDFADQEDLKQLGAEAFAFVNIARFAVPLRIGLALSTAPWIQRNIVDRFEGKTRIERQ